MMLCPRGTARRLRQWRSVLVLVVILVVLLVWMLRGTTYTEAEIHQYLATYNKTCLDSTTVIPDEDTATKLIPCPCVPHAGLAINLTPPKKNVSLYGSAQDLDNVQTGGRWKPRDCLPRHQVAIIVPYRDRRKHLDLFLRYMHSFLQRQQLQYQIFVIEQIEPALFNRASLMNIGFLEARRLGQFTCYIFHDVDLLPLDDLTLYNCVQSPLHLGAYMSTNNYKKLYKGFTGGVLALSAEHVHLINGFSNHYFGWGGEDDDVYNRVIHRNLQIQTHPEPLGRMLMMDHLAKQDPGNPPNPRRYTGYSFKPNAYTDDGFNTVKYEKHRVDETLYTHISVSIEKPVRRECLVNPSQPTYRKDNYVDCINPDNYATGDVDCCRDGRQIVCCNKDNWKRVFIIVAGGTGGATVLVALAFSATKWRFRNTKF